MGDIAKAPGAGGEASRESGITHSPEFAAAIAPHPSHGELQRHFGLVHATALNISMIVGAGVFAVIPLMLLELPGPYALLGWVGAGMLILMDGLIWSELGAMMPGSGGSYLYLLESFGRERWGRLMAFLFIWQFLLSGPLELASGLIAMANFSNALHPDFALFNKNWTRELVLLPNWDLKVVCNPARLAALGIGLFILLLLYRRITVLGKLTVVVWLGVLGMSAWILFEGFRRFNWQTAFDFGAQAAAAPHDFASHLGSAMILAMYSYLGYYHICYMGDEVREPGRTIPRSILLSAVLVCILFIALHLAMLGVVSWQRLPHTEGKELDDYNLPAEFMRHIYGDGAAALITVLLIGSCFGSTFAGLLGYSRIPYGAARYGHFFCVFGRVQPALRIPHISLFAVGGLTLFWVFFDLQKVITALITLRIIEQFIAQIFGLMILRRTHPEWPRPYRVWLYPLPCLAALVGWAYLYWAAGWLFIIIGLMTLLAGIGAFVLWSLRLKQWPFTASE